jgi:glutaminase
MAAKKKQYEETDSVIRIFNALDKDSKGFIIKGDLLDALHDRGILEDDARIRETTLGLKKYKGKQRISAKAFRELVHPHITLIEKALTGALVIPDFKNFGSFITNLYNRTLQNKKGNVSDYIPELASVDPKNYALSVCTVDGQRFNIGNFKKPYLARSTATPVNYCLALKDGDEVELHKKVGRAPKEKGFDYLLLNQDGLPHNPITAAGALMVGSMVHPKGTPKARLDRVLKMWKAFAGDISPGFNTNAFASEKKVADEHRALAYFMQKQGLFPRGSNVNRHLELLWQCYALETTTEAQAIMAATLANAGVCPTNEREVFTPDISKHCLSVMFAAGMKDYSNEYAFSVGLPAVSGISGVVMIVVPDVLGMVIWSPRIDEDGNSLKGLDLSHKLVERFRFHNFESSLKSTNKVDPRLKKNATKMTGVMAVTSAASIGDVHELQRLYSAGVDLNEAEYDGRTGIHLATSEGHLEAVKFFVEKNVNINPKDRWGGTPVADAKREGHKDVLAFLKKHGGREKI